MYNVSRFQSCSFNVMLIDIFRSRDNTVFTRLFDLDSASIRLKLRLQCNLIHVSAIPQRAPF